MTLETNGKCGASDLGALCGVGVREDEVERDGGRLVRSIVNEDAHIELHNVTVRLHLQSDVVRLGEFAEVRLDTQHGRAALCTICGTTSVLLALCFFPETKHCYLTEKPSIQI